MPLFKVLMKQEAWQEVVVEADDHRDAMDLASLGEKIESDEWELDAPMVLSAVRIDEEE